MLEIVVPDTVTLLQPLFTSRMSPRERFAAGQALITAPDGLRVYTDAVTRNRYTGGYAVMEAVLQDGYPAIEGRQMYGLFNPARAVAASEWQFATFAAQDILGRMRHTLEQCASLVPDAWPGQRFTAVVVPGDPANFRFMLGAHGLSGFGGVAKQVLLELWPSAGNISRLGPCLARFFAHSYRNATAYPLTQGPRTLGDYIALEGLAAAFVAQLFPAEHAPWRLPFSAPQDWERALAQVAAFSHVADYAAIKSNAYGAPETPADVAVPIAHPLAPDELAYAHDIIASALEETDPRRIAAYLYGDAIAGRQGHAVIGLPSYAGFAVAAAWVHDAIAAQHLTLPTAFATPTAVLLR